MAREIVALVQPNSCSSGTISTDGADRTPAATRKVVKATATMVQA